MTLPAPAPHEHPTLAEASAVMRKAYEQGWISTRDGNISVAMSDRRGFLVSASGVVKHSLVPTQFVFVPNGETGAPSADAYPPPSGELELHRRIQQRQQLSPRRRRNLAGELGPQPLVGDPAALGDQPLQGRDARQQGLAGA